MGGLHPMGSGPCVLQHPEQRRGPPARGRHTTRTCRAEEGPQGQSATHGAVWRETRVCLPATHARLPPPAPPQPPNQARPRMCSARASPASVSQHQALEMVVFPCTPALPSSEPNVGGRGGGQMLHCGKWEQVHLPSPPPPPSSSRPVIMSPSPPVYPSVPLAGFLEQGGITSARQALPPSRRARHAGAAGQSRQRRDKEGQG